MGMDLFGLKPDDPAGEYFRVTSQWSRLWDFVNLCCEGVITDKDNVGAQFNDGYRITKKKALIIADKMEAAIADRGLYETMLCFRGRAFANLEDWSESDEDWPLFPWELAASFARFCRHSGGFKMC